MYHQPAAEHQDFANGILAPGRVALRGMSVANWIEERAECFSQLGRVGPCIVLNHSLRQALQIREVRRHEYIPIHEMAYHTLTRQMNWTGSILLGDHGHSVSVIRGKNSAEIRALEAHEFGHALLYSEPRIWKTLVRRALLVDQGAERLADDAGRALVLPKGLLRELLGLQPTQNTQLGSDDLWSRIPQISSWTVLPSRIVASRMAALLLERNAAILCYAIPRQGNLFEASFRSTNGLSRATADLRWIMRYSWLSDRGGVKDYLFADRVGRPRRVVLQGTLLQQADAEELNEMDPELIQKLVGERNWREISNFQSFRRVAVNIRDHRFQFFVLCR